MMKNNFSMVENIKTIPFANGYSLLANGDFPEWFLKFKRRAFETYLKNYDAIDPEVKKFISKDDFVQPRFDIAPSFDVLLKYKMLDVEAYTIILVNGRYCPELSIEEELPFSVFSDGIAYSLTDDKKFLEGQLKCDDNPLLALNSSYLSNGVVVDIESGTKISKPIHIISIVFDDSDKLFVNTRIFVNIGDNVSVDIIESNFSLDEKYFENKVCQFNIGKNSDVRHYKYFDVSKNSCVVENNFCELDNCARFNQVAFAKKMGLFKNYYQYDVAKKSELNSVMAVDANDDMCADVSAIIKHKNDDGISNVSLFATVNDRADVNFTTSVECVNGISGVQTNQISRILLNSMEARGRIKPLQNIWSEKIKAYHGAVVSGVDKKDLFFLESRGFDEKSAKNLILRSCLANILQNIHNEEIYSAFYNLIWL